MKKTIGVVHAIATCNDCNWTAEHLYKNAQAIAAIHAKKHKHKVEVEVGIACTYDGRA